MTDPHSHNHRSPSHAMPGHSLDPWQHSHDFAVIHAQGERKTQLVLLFTAVTMLVEIAAGMTYGSMALLADGWHMATHVAAFAITLFAYRYARKHANNAAFTFGTGKVCVLGGFASAVALVVVSLLMLIESGQRLVSPQPIHFNQAIAVALLGLLVNIACAFLLQDHHSHGQDEDHGAHHHDHNLKAAYLHVLADALTSLLALAALISGKYLGWHWLDPLMGIVGAAVITRWAWGLLQETSPLLLDSSIDGAYLNAIRKKIESATDTEVADIHVWKVGPSDYAAIISVVTHSPRETGYYKELLREFRELSHLTIEINICAREPCLSP